MEQQKGLCSLSHIFGFLGKVFHNFIEVVTDKCNFDEKSQFLNLSLDVMCGVKRGVHCNESDTFLEQIGLPINDAYVFCNKLGHKIVNVKNARHDYM